MNGIFPMSDARNDPEIFWVEPRIRAILPLDGFHLPKSLAKVIRQDRFEITADRAFAQVIAACAEAAPDRAETWINSEIEQAFVKLHKMGFAHSIECWREGKLVGGLYGLSVGRAFFGESMFSRATDASKTALAALVARLRMGGYALLDCQFMTEHLAKFGAIEMPQEEYLKRLHHILSPDRSGQFAGEGAAGAVAPPSLPPSADWSAFDSALSSAGAEDLRSSGFSSPGKLILHCLTQTS